MADHETRDVLVTRYGQIYAEIVRYRDYEWRITEVTLLLMGALIAALLQYKDKLSSGPLGLVMKLVVLVLVVGAGAFGVWGLRFIHAALALNRKMRAEIERELDLPQSYAHQIKGTKAEDYASIWPFNMPFTVLIACVALLGVLIVSGAVFK
jgi:hypothetical protein